MNSILPTTANQVWASPRTVDQWWSWTCVLYPAICGSLIWHWRITKLKANKPLALTSISTLPAQSCQLHTRCKTHYVFVFLGLSFSAGACNGWLSFKRVLPIRKFGDDICSCLQNQHRSNKAIQWQPQQDSLRECRGWHCCLIEFAAALSSIKHVNTSAHPDTASVFGMANKIRHASRHPFHSLSSSCDQLVRVVHTSSKTHSTDFNCRSPRLQGKKTTKWMCISMGFYMFYHQQVAG